MRWDKDDLLCTDLNTIPKPELGKILVTGATGYIGGRLVTELLARGYHVRVMARVDEHECKERWPEAETVVADALDQNQLIEALKDIHAAYYLMHSLLVGQKKFEKTDLKAAVNFRMAADINGIKRIIYLDTLDSNSRHLASKMTNPILISNLISNELQVSKIPVTQLRASTIIGSGSASYEIIKNLVIKSPLILVPKWARNKCQPVSLRSLIQVLVGVLETKETTGKSYDICGDEVLTYEKMLRIFAEILHKRRIFIDTGLSNSKFYSYIASLLTPVPEFVIRSLIIRWRYESICNKQDEIFSSLYRPMKFKEAILRAMTREERDAVHTRWSDEYPRAHELAIKLNELDNLPHYVSSYSILSNKPENALFQSFCIIGGEEGWLHNNWMWRLRGILDQLFLGVGISRGRRSSSTLRLNDVIDFWRVEDIQENKILLLRAEMKLPGMAWLEFKLNKVQEKNHLTVSAYYEPKSILGKLYWYFFLPFHYIIFTNLLKQIDIKS